MERVRDEAERFVETCAMVITALESRQPGLVCSLVDALPDEPLPNGRNCKLVFWAYYADWIVQQSTSGDPPDSGEWKAILSSQWKTAASTFATGRELLKAFDAPRSVADLVAEQDQLLAMSAMATEERAV